MILVRADLMTFKGISWGFNWKFSIFLTRARIYVLSFGDQTSLESNYEVIPPEELLGS